MNSLIFNLEPEILLKLLSVKDSLSLKIKAFMKFSESYKVSLEECKDFLSPEDFNFSSLSLEEKNLTFNEEELFLLEGYLDESYEKYFLSDEFKEDHRKIDDEDSNFILELDLSDMKLDSLENFVFPYDPIYLDVSNNNLKNLKGCPSSVKYLYCYNNNLETLEGVPPYLITLVCWNNRIKSLEHIEELEFLYTDNNLLTSMKYPKNIIYIDCCENMIEFFPDPPDSLEKICKTKQQISN